MTASHLDQTCVNTIRFLAADAVQKANSGHPGMPMGMAGPAYVLWTEFLKYDPADPHWPDRDRFVLSAGHGSMLLYAMLHLTGHALTLEDIKNFRQWGSKTPGHPEFHDTPGVETTTGPLGQGLSTAVGMALGESHLAAVYNGPARKVMDHRTWVIAGDGCLMEGISSEAASLAGHLRLGKLKVIWDDNRISIDGSTDLAFTENVPARFAAYGWRVIEVEDANDLAAVRAAFTNACANEDRPVFIRIRSVIGFGSPNRQGTHKAHGEPLGADELKLAKKNLGWPEEETFRVPAEAKDHMTKAGVRGKTAHEAWKKTVAAWGDSESARQQEFLRRMSGLLPENWEAQLPVYTTADKSVPTRKVNPKVLDALHGTLPELMGGSADLAPSCFTVFSKETSYQPGHHTGRNLHYGVREHAMGAVMNGLSLHGGFRPFGSTFLVFADYMRPAIRMSALMRQPVIYVFTHDTVALGEDGPTHQPIEHVASLRAIPNLVVIRPADANEGVEAWRFALEHKTGPVAMVQSRQNLPVMDPAQLAPASGLRKGGYILAEATGGKPEAILIATGSEVALALEARAALEAKGRKVRVVSLPSWEIFDAQPQSYRDSVLPPAVRKRVAVEALSPFGWERYTGPEGAVVGINRFGASAPGDRLMKEFGFTAENVIAAVERVLGG